MREYTHLGNMMHAIEMEKMDYDQQVKAVLADLQILARIVKHTVSEVKHLSIEEIMECIDADAIEIGERPVLPGMTNSRRIESCQNENYIPNEGFVVFDIRFMLIYREKMLKIIINVEAQKSTNVKKLGYHLESRIVYYLARLISSQKGQEFSGSNYDDIKKVYSIWICMDAKKGRESISKIVLN